MTHPLKEFADEFERAAETADDPEQRDACKVLAAFVRGEPVPRDVAQRILDRTRAEQ